MRFILVEVSDEKKAQSYAIEIVDKEEKILISNSPSQEIPPQTAQKIKQLIEEIKQLWQQQK